MSAPAWSRIATVLSCGWILTACVQPPVYEPPAAPRPVEAKAKKPQPTSWEMIGKSVEGRFLRYRKLGDGPRQVLWIGGIHGNEIEGTVATRELQLEFLASPRLQSQVTLHVVEDINPDGREARRRTNANGQDLNRDFPARNRKPGQGPGLSQPESKALHDLIRRLEPDLIMVAHSWKGRFFINYDGPARAAAALFARLSGFPLVPSSSFNATPGSLGSWAGWDMHIPILTIEWQRPTDPELAWHATREAILAMVAGDYRSSAGADR